ncbi:MAG: hypothetical protein AB7V26_14455, partial [Lysobacterales bacterium]
GIPFLSNPPEHSESGIGTSLLLCDNAHRHRVNSVAVENGRCRASMAWRAWWMRRLIHPTSNTPEASVDTEHGRTAARLRPAAFTPATAARD